MAVVHLGGGLSRDAYAAEVTVAAPHAAASGPYAVLLPRGPRDRDLDARTHREHDLLARLHALPVRLPFRVPEPLAVVLRPDAAVLVRGFIRGVELDLRAGRQRAFTPWDIVGQVAAGVHAVDVAPLADLYPRPLTRRAFAEAELTLALHGLDGPEVRTARAWAGAHLPPDSPAVLVHGDLLGQNILVDPSADPALAVVDWEYARLGDPAYDLAIVTRGGRQPFQTAGGLDLLVDAYRAHGGAADVTRDHVRIFELCLICGWHRETLAGHGPAGHGPDQTLAQLRAFIRRLGTGAA